MQNQNGMGFNNFYNGVNTAMNGGGFDYSSFPRANVQNNSNYSYISCRIINSVEEITPGEIPMNGNIALFFMSDGSKIIAKKWNSSGLIDTEEYESTAPVVTGTVDESPSPYEEINLKLDKVLTYLSQSTNRRSNKKGGEVDE